MLNIGFAGFVYDNSDVLGNVNIKYQAYFRKVNSSSSSSAWGTVKTIDANGYYSLNLGDGDFLTQSGIASTGDKVVIVFWKPTTEGRTSYGLVEWGEIEITLTSASSYLKDVQIKTNQSPLIVSWTLAATARLHEVVTAINGSSDEHSWTAHGTLTYQFSSRYGVEMTPISAIETSRFDWGDTTQDTYPGAGDGSHAWTAIGDYDVNLLVTDYSGAFDDDTKSIRIKYRIPVCGILLVPVSPTIEEVALISPTITDIDSRVATVDYYVDSVLIHSGVSKTFSWNYQFPTNEQHIIRQVLHWNDGFADGTVIEDFTVTMSDLPPVVDIDTEVIPVNAAEYDFAGTAVDPDGTIVNWNWKIYLMSSPIELIVEKEGADLENFSYVFSSDGDFRVTLTCTDDNGSTGSHSEDFTVSIVPVATITITAYVAKVELAPPLQIVVKKK